MFVLNDYPFHIVQQPTFLSLIDNMQPNFKMVGIGTMEAKALGNIPGRISLTIGSLTINRILVYISLATQFIDSEWRLHRRMLNFMMAPWPRLENVHNKLFTITLEHDYLSHDIYSANLRNHLSK
uniref:Uncharacterized protein n=1 Tax=Oryza punctata TaxID=4537 RepID=A0A0E0LVP3_ORYPU